MSAPSAAAKAAAAERIRHLSSSSSSLLHSSSLSSDANDSSSEAKPLHPPKRVLLLRHGQALHNPRAEAARENGCSFDTFLSLMEEDDAFDAALTGLGENQAREAGRQDHVKHALRNIEMIVSSPLSRALNTADLVHPPPDDTNIDSLPRRVCVEDFREINGKLLNAQRLPRKDLEQNFPHWCFGNIPALDESWTKELEPRDECSNRGYGGLLWIMQQPEQHMMLVCHGGLLSYTMNHNPNVVLVDRRKEKDGDERCITKRFGNCEMREFVMTAWNSNDYSSGDKTDMMNGQASGEIMGPVITLEEMTMEVEDLCT